MNILITAPKSYFIKNLLKVIPNKNFKFIIIQNKNSDKRVIKKIFKDFNFIILPIKRIIKSNSELKKLKIKIVINSINSYHEDNNFIKTYNSNVTIPSKIFSCIKNLNINYFINIDTILDRRTNFYALSKYIFRNFIKYSNFNSKFRVINLRYHNFYSNDIDDKNIISIISKFSKENKKFLMTKGVQKRDFIHINDATNLVLQILKNIKKFKNKNYFEFKVGGGEIISINEIAKLIRKFFKSNEKLNLKEIKYKSIYEKINYSSCNKELKKYLNWEPRYNIRKKFAVKNK